MLINDNANSCLILAFITVISEIALKDIFATFKLRD